jgi:hypothetical protein
LLVSLCCVRQKLVEVIQKGVCLLDFVSGLLDVRLSGRQSGEAIGHRCIAFALASTSN